MADQFPASFILSLELHGTFSNLIVFQVLALIPPYLSVSLANISPFNKTVSQRPSCKFRCLMSVDNQFEKYRGQFSIWAITQVQKGSNELLFLATFPSQYWVSQIIELSYNCLKMNSRVCDVETSSSTSLILGPRANICTIRET